MGYKLNPLSIPQEKFEGPIFVRFDRLGLNFELHPHSLNSLVSRLRVTYKSKDLRKDLDHATFITEIKNFVSEQFNAEAHPERELNSIISFVYLAVGIAIAKEIDEIVPFDVSLCTEMSIGAGLGSSASFGVCLAGAFVVLAK